MKFTQLRLSGFKSFVEPTELLIKDGLTGIVGPNGCGKSNLVEALTWVMGETSAKNMRGGAMDDVIFAGTASRPPRNAAEVSLGLDNKERKAPASYNDSSELDITRRIRRESGSDYRINGKVTRARDVQLLFADLATGAHSTAIVSQGRVGALINAKPKERRHLLEEAAGISGLHSRRHEAELRLNSAETNLERVDDVVEQLEAQLGNLKRQARQANRYRNISGHIRKAEAMLLYKKYSLATEKSLEARSKYEEAVSAVNELTRQAARAETASVKANEALKPLRDKEAEAAAAVHRLTLARENLDAEEERARQAKEKLEGRKNQISSDMAREKNLEKDSAEAITRLEAEKLELIEASKQDAPTIEKLLANVNSLQTEVNSLQADFDTETQKVAAAVAESNTLTQQITSETEHLERMKSRLAEFEKEKQVLEIALSAIGDSPQSNQSLEDGIASLNQLASQYDALEASRLAADSQERENQQSLKTAESDVTHLKAEETALLRLLETASEGEWPAIIEGLKVKAGYEVALGAALGDELEAPTDPEAPVFWSDNAAKKISQGFPDELETLNKFVSGQESLKARLSQIAVVSQEIGDKLQPVLKPGQRLVSRDGDLWRWDGYVRKAGATTAAAVRLEQRNRLQEIQADLVEKQESLEKARKNLDQASEKSKISQEALTKCRAEQRELEQSVSKLRALHAEETRVAAAKQSRLTSLNESENELRSEISSLEASLGEKHDTMDALPDTSVRRESLQKLKAELADSRENLAIVRSESDQKQRESASRKDRLASIDQETANWIERNKNMAEHFVQLEMRFNDTRQELQELEGRPEEIAAKRNSLMDEVARAEGARSSIKDKLAEAEAILAECDSALHKCQEALASCREERVKYQSDMEHSSQILSGLSEQISEKLDCKPDQILEAGGISEGEDIPPVDASERRLERLKKERDGMGPVNLRAEIEAKEVEEQLSTLQKEREDLESAIARLRQGIASLNKEGRQRLLAAFKDVDKHFQDLFKRVFGGGSAHLTLTESDDPLSAGLEIMASPPGKKLQLMSLLSGGEQALTAVALLFAVFLTNPAPICVLDEVDAPLDDVNVERLCHLLEGIAENSDTRFLVVTHHPITMARMDRLFGVTMAERGISQLVSVDLEKAKLITETAA